FQKRAGIALRALLPQSADPRCEALAHLQAVATGDFLEFKGPPLAALAEHLQRRAQLRRIGPLDLVEQFAQTFQGQRLARGQQQGFQQGGQIVWIGQVHACSASARTRTWMGAKGSFCTSSTRDSLMSSRMAMKVTTTPRRPS